MDTYQIQAQLFKILMHPTRLAILNELRNDEQCVCHLEARLGLRQAYICQHLMQMRDAGLVIDRRDGWNIFYRVARPEIFQVIDSMQVVSKMVSHEKGIMIQVESKAPSKQPPCPCPKCNPQQSSTYVEAPELKMESNVSP
jgi:DNA-binding transcriptional ArsR family regulator